MIHPTKNIMVNFSPETAKQMSFSCELQDKELALQYLSASPRPPESLARFLRILIVEKSKTSKRAPSKIQIKACLNSDGSWRSYECDFSGDSPLLDL